MVIVHFRRSKYIGSNLLRAGTVILVLLLSLCAAAQHNTLDYYLGYAIKNSPLLKDFQNQVASLSIDSQILRATLRPQVTGVSNNLYAPVINGYGYDEAITNKGQLQALLSVNKAFVGRRSIATQIAGFTIEAQSATNNIRLSQQDIKKTITDQYIVTFGDWLQLQFNKEINELLGREDSLLKRLTQANVFKQADYLAFAVTRQQQLLNTTQLEIQYNFDYAALNYLSGIRDTLAAPVLEDPRLTLNSLPDYTSSAFYRQYVLDSLKLRNDRALIDINYRPKINAVADAGYNSSLTVHPGKNMGASVGLNLSVPIYDGRQRRLQYQKIDLQEQTRQAKRDYFISQREQQIFQLLQQLHATEKLISDINQQIRYTETLITVNEKLLGTGDIRVTDFILSLTNYFNARYLVTQNYIDRLKIINQLNYWNR
ncbi:TolC family protein [Niastella vici]|nr:TolC family protein [Niastella vici]